MFKLDVLQAKYGDCLLLHAGEKDPVRILIDSGPNATFEQALKPRLAALSKESFAGLPAKIHLAIISHIDTDHIGGFISLLKYEKEAKGGEHDSLVQLGQLWHNSFFDIGGASVRDNSGTRESSVSIASTALELFASTVAEARSDFGVVMAGVAQGNQVSELARFHRIPVNQGFPDKLVIVGTSIDDFKPVSLHVLGPKQAEIDDLREKWVEYMEDLQKKDSNVKATAQTLDTAVANLSSIVMMAAYDGKRILLTGDARGDHVLDALEGGGWVRNGVCHVDVFKWPHHGSINNFPEGIFDRIIADHHIISANGRHDNPDIETIERFVKAHQPDQRTVLHMTYAAQDVSQKYRSHFDKVNRLLSTAIAAGHRIAVETPAPKGRWLTVDVA